MKLHFKEDKKEGGWFSDAKFFLHVRLELDDEDDCWIECRV